MRTRIPTLVVFVVGLGTAAIAEIPNARQVEVAESTADNFMDQCRRNVTEIEDVGQGFGVPDLKPVEELSGVYGDIVRFHRTGSRRGLQSVTVDFDVERTKGVTNERVSMMAGYTQSYSRDFAIVRGHEVLSVPSLR